MSNPPPYPGNEKGGMNPPPTAYPQQAYGTQYGQQGGAYPQQQYGMQPAPPPDYPQAMVSPSAPPMSGYQAPPPQKANLQQAYPQQGNPQQAYPQQGNPQQAYPQQGYPQQGYPQQGYPQIGTTVVVTKQPTVVVQRFRETPVHVTCPFCHADIVTATSYETGTFAWLMCALMCIFGLDAGCCLIPFCCDACQDVIHTCPNCRQMIQRWNRL